MKKLVTIMAIGTLMACSSERRIKDVAYHVAVDENPGQQILALEEKINNARKNQVDILSPTWFASAVMSLNQAKEIRDSNGDINDLAREVAEGNEQLKRAQGFADVSRRELADVIEKRNQAIVARQNARGAGAARLGEIQEQFSDADEEFMDLTEAVEDGKVSEIAEEKSDLIKRYVAIETLALKKEKLDAARRVVDQAIREGAKDYAPRTLAAAQQTLRAAESFISNSPAQSQAVEEKADDAVFYANRALTITREAKQVSEKKPEEVVLWMEDVIVNVGNEVGAGDRRDRRFDEQLSAVHESLRGLRDQGKTAAQPEVRVPLKNEERM